MRRMVLAAMVVAAAGVVALVVPARASTSYGATMANATPTGYKFAKGDCDHVNGNGDFTVQVGDEITWRNCTQAPHTVTADDGSFDSGNVESGATFAHTFATEGTVKYHCTIHTYMTGTVTVATPTVPTTPLTTATTRAPATTTTKPTTTTTTKTTTTTSDDFSGVFDDSTSSTEPTTTLFSTGTTRALGQGGDSGTSAGLVAALVLGLGAVGTAAALLVRRMRGGTTPG